MEYCGALLKTCRECGEKFREGEEVCAICDEPRGYCRNSGSGKNGRCPLHGGNALSGAASHATLSARYLAENTPSQFVDKYIRYLEDTEHDGMRNLDAIVDSRIEALISRTEPNVSSKLFKDLKKIEEDIELWLKMPKSNNMRAKKLGELTIKRKVLIQRGYEDAVAWEEIYKTIDIKRKLDDQKLKREKVRKDSVSRDRVDAMFGAVFFALLQNIKDPKLIDAVFSQINGVAKEYDVDVVEAELQPLDDAETIKLLEELG